MINVCEILGTEYPVIQGAMARIADCHLAAAVSNGGGLGIIAAGGQTAQWLREEIRKTKEMTDKPFGVNIMLLADNVDELMDVVCEEKVKVITTGAGNPGKYIPRLKENGIKVIPVVASVALAKRVERAGADAVVAEGTEAGGHIGETTTMAMIPQMADALSIPVIAAGGIADGRGIAAAYMLGAERRSGGDEIPRCRGMYGGTELQGRSHQSQGYRYGGYGKIHGTPCQSHQEQAFKTGAEAGKGKRR